MQIWKSPNMFVYLWKYYLKNFAFLILRILKLSTHEVCHVFENRLILRYILLFWMFVNKHFTYLTCAYVRFFFVWNFQHTIIIWRRTYQQIFKSAFSLINRLIFLFSKGCWVLDLAGFGRKVLSKWSPHVILASVRCLHEARVISNKFYRRQSYIIWLNE